MQGRARRHAAALLPHLQGAQRKRVLRQARALRLHPTQADWYLQHATLRTGQRLWLAVPPVEYRWGLIGAYHDRLGHAGINQCYAAMHQHYSWPGMRADVQAFISQCHPCQKRRLETEVPMTTEVPAMSEPLQHVHIDLAGPFEVREATARAGGDSEGSNRGRGRGRGRQSAGRRRGSLSTTKVGQAYVAIMVDYFTKAAEFVAIPDKRASTVATAFHDRWLLRFGVPEQLTSDNGGEFQAAFDQLVERFGVEHIFISAHNPQANGAVERLVQSMKAILGAKFVDAVSNWQPLLPQVQAEYMQRTHSTTGFSPNELLYAVRINLPPPLGPSGRQTWRGLMCSARVPTGPQEDIQDREYAQWRALQQARHSTMVQVVCDRIQAAQQRNLRQQQARKAPALARRGGGLPLQVGDLAYLCEPRGRTQRARGPFVVVAVPSEAEPSVVLRTTAQVAGQAPKQFKRHPSLVARCTTVVDALERLLKQEGLSTEHGELAADELARRHAPLEAAE